MTCMWPQSEQQRDQFELNGAAEEFPLEDSKRLCVHLLEEAMAQLPPGSDTLLGIFDLRGFGNRNADLGFVRFLVRPLCYARPLQ